MPARLADRLRELTEQLADRFSESTHTYTIRMALGIEIDRTLREAAAELDRLAALAVPPVPTAGWHPPTDAQIDSTAEDIASDTSCCDISSSCSWAIGNHIRKLLGLPEEAA